MQVHHTGFRERSIESETRGILIAIGSPYGTRTHFLEGLFFQVSEHFLSILGGIAARDFPERWPTLYTDAITCIQNAEPKVRVKGMRLIHHCLKAMLSVGMIN